MNCTAYDLQLIARNTRYLYLRTLLLTVADVVSARLALDALGLNGYALFAAVAGFVSSLRFLNGKVEETALRFLSLAIGHKDEERRTFVGVLSLTAVLGVIMAVVGETAFRWFAETKLTLPPDLKDQVNPVFHVGIAVSVVRTLRLPFTSFVIAEEKMGFVAAASALEAALAVAAAGVVGVGRGERRSGIRYSCWALTCCCWPSMRFAAVGDLAVFASGFPNGETWVCSSGGVLSVPSRTC